MGPQECKNIYEDPTKGFEMSFEDMDRLDDPDVIGTFHTHPGQGANLSQEDYESFLDYPALTHYIVGKDGIRTYKIINGRVLNES